MINPKVENNAAERAAEKLAAEDPDPHSIRLTMVK
jgi:hypothetical protein